MNNVNAVYSSNPHFPGQQFGGHNANGIDLSSQYQQQHLADTQSHGQSPSLQHTPFQVPAVVPAKRSRPGDDNAGTPSHLGPGVHSRSRSQTPQQQYPPYSGQTQSQQFHTPTTMQHMQQTMSPSPAHQQQAYRPPAMGPYNQIQQMNRLGNPQERMGVPPNAAQQAFMRQNAQMAGQGNPSAGGQMAAGTPQANMSRLQMQQEAMRRQYQAHLAQTGQQLQGGHLPHVNQGGPNPSMGDPHKGSWGHGANGQVSAHPPMSQALNQGDGSQEKAFIKSLAQFHEQRQRRLNLDPRVCGHPISYFMLFRKYAEINPGANPQAWAAVAAGLGLPQDQNGDIIRELRVVFEQDLQSFYFHYYQAMRNRKLNNARGPSQFAGSMGLQGSPQQPNSQMPRAANQTPVSQPQSQSQPAISQGPSPNLLNNSMPDEFSKHPSLLHKSSAEDMPSQQSSEHQTSGPTPQHIGHAEQTQVESTIPSLKVERDDLSAVQAVPATNGNLADHSQIADIGIKSEPNHEYSPTRHTFTTYGGVDLESLDFAGSRLHDLKTFPRYEELSLVDLHVVSLCLQSGFEAEVNYALDQLAALSQRPLVLARCEDLLESLVEFGDEQARSILKATGSSAALDIQSFESITKSSLLEVESVQTNPEFGENAYACEHAIERLLAVTTILRNLSFPVHEATTPDRDADSNSKLLISPPVKVFLTNVTKIVAAGPTCFRTARNAQDLMKDLVTLYSNIADNLELSSEDEARSILQFLVAFAPTDAMNSKPHAFRFASFDAAKHHYLPCAIDSLAKILARDDPNRTLCRSVFASEIAGSPRESEKSLLTRAFALAVAPIPDGSSGTFSTNAATHLAGRRRPLLSQGMLAADILSTLVPTTAFVSLLDSRRKQSLERAWLESGDAWASRLMRLVVAMAMSDSQGAVQRDTMTQAVVDDSSRGFVAITQRALSMLRRLVDRSDRWDANNGGDSSKSASLSIFGAVPLDEVLFSAVSIPRFDMETMRGLTALASLSRGN